MNVSHIHQHWELETNSIFNNSPFFIKILETRLEESSSADLKSKCKHKLHKNDVDMTNLLDSSDLQLVSIYKPRRCAAAALDFRALNVISLSLPVV
jgi:hypothetical protein